MGPGPPPLKGPEKVIRVWRVGGGGGGGWGKVGGRGPKALLLRLLLHHPAMAPETHGPGQSLWPLLI